jgi:hypothetical protein
MKHLIYVFEPKLLKQETEKIKKDYSHMLGQNYVNKAKNIDIRKLFEQIMSISVSELNTYANNLINRELYGLAYYLGFVEEIELQKRIVAILSLRWKNRYLPVVWDAFQTHYNNKALILLLNNAFQKDLPFEMVTDEVRPIFKEAYATGEPTKTFVEHLIISLEPFNKEIEKLKVRGESALASFLKLETLINGQERTFLREEACFIIEVITISNRLSQEKIVDQYLSKVGANKYHKSVMFKILEIFKKPFIKENDRWRNISVESQQRFHKWLLANTLEEFFQGLTNDSERFAYWKRFIKEFTDVSFIKNPSVLFMYFSKFVVTSHSK